MGMRGRLASVVCPRPASGEGTDARRGCWAYGGSVCGVLRVGSVGCRSGGGCSVWWVLRWHSRCRRQRRARRASRGVTATWWSSRRWASSSSLHFVSPGGVVRKTIDAFTGVRGFRGSPDGRRLLFQQGDGIRVSDLYGVSRREVVRVGEQPTWAQPTWAPDGRHLAFVRGGSVWIAGLDGRGVRRVTSVWQGVPSGWVSRDEAPAWSPDGLTIAFVRRRLAGPQCMSRTDL